MNYPRLDLTRYNRPSLSCALPSQANPNRDDLTSKEAHQP